MATSVFADNSGYTKPHFSPSLSGSDVMVRDGVADIVSRLRECGFDPRKVGQDVWESRCPAHRSRDHALSMTRNEFNHVVQTCRGAGVTSRSQALFLVFGWTDRRRALIPATLAKVTTPAAVRLKTKDKSATVVALSANQRQRLCHRSRPSRCETNRRLRPRHRIDRQGGPRAGRGSATTDGRP
jgi:hypothetical protein